jgi:hypothetical protein
VLILSRRVTEEKNMSQPDLFIRRLALLVLLALVFGLVLPVGPAMAAPLGQGDEVTAESLILGQYVLQPMSTDETRLYEINIPESGVYQIAPVDAEAAEAFDLIVTDAEGNELFNDVFEGPSVSLTLEPGNGWSRATSYWSLLLSKRRRCSSWSWVRLAP